MMPMTFSPKLRTESDALERWLLAVAQYLLLGTVALLPVFFFPNSQVSLSFSKSFLLLVGTLVSLIVFSLFLLRIGIIRVVAPGVLVALWSVGLLAVASALLSGDRLDALVGDTLQIQTAAFLLILATVASVTALVVDSKAAIIRFFISLSVIAFVLELWHILRFSFGPNFLSFGVFTSATASPVGSFNDLALFAALVIILSIVSLVQLPLRGLALWFVGALIAMSMTLLVVINFFAVWLVVGFFALLVFLYSLTRDRLFVRKEVKDTAVNATVSKPVLAVLGAVCAVAAVFVVAGSYVGGAVSSALGVQYLEVRPSFSATLEIMNATYRDDGAFLGIGPNRFEDAWRLHKNPVINETLFWNTAFAAGSGYVPTLFVTIGIAGGALFLLFLGLFSWSGYRMLIQPQTHDPFWYFVGTAAFAAAMFLWGMSLLYVPGTVLLIMAAFWTGLALVAYTQLTPRLLRVFACTDNRARAFVLIAVMMIVITTSIGTMFALSKQYAAHLIYARAVAAVAAAPSLEVADVALVRAYSLFPSDVLLAERVRLRLSTLGALLNVTSPTEEERRRFDTAAVEALEFAGQAVALDTSSPANHALLGSVYGVIALTSTDDTRQVARDMAAGSFARARELDPLNPEYALIEAQLAVRLGNPVGARELLGQSLEKKRNYVDALFLLSQLDVAEGNTVGAITAVRSLITIEPQNPSRYFQLGALLLAAQDRPGAVAALETAVALDPNFANARYLLALTLVEEGERERALEQLRVVAITNSENETLRTLITALESGQEINAPLGGITPPVQESGQVSVDSEGVATSATAPETDLIVPVNQTSDNGEPASGAARAEEVLVPEAATPTE